MKKRNQFNLSSFYDSHKKNDKKKNNNGTVDEENESEESSDDTLQNRLNKLPADQVVQPKETIRKT